MPIFLVDTFQGVKINNSYSLRSLMKYGVSQGLILGPILFNIVLYDMLFMIDNVDIASYANDCMSYSVGTKQCELEKNYKKHQTKFVYGSIKMA